MVTPGRTQTCAPIHTLLPTVMGRAYSSPLFRCPMSKGWPAAEADLGLVQDDAIHVGIEVFADFDVVAVVAEEGLLYQEVFPRFPQQGFQQLRPPPGFRRRQLVVCIALVLAQLPFGYQLRVVVGVV